MALQGISPLLLSQDLRRLFLAPVQLLYPLIMIVYRHAQYFFGAILSDHELIEVLLKHLWGDSRRAERGSGSQRA